MTDKRAFIEVKRKPRIRKVGPDRWSCDGLVDSSGYIWSVSRVITGTGKTPKNAYAWWWASACVHRGEYSTPWSSLFPLQSPQAETGNLKRT